MSTSSCNNCRLIFCERTVSSGYVLKTSRTRSTVLGHIGILLCSIHVVSKLVDRVVVSECRSEVSTRLCLADETKWGGIHEYHDTRLQHSKYRRSHRLREAEKHSFVTMMLIQHVHHAV
jgi:hypothetical protein